MICWAHFPNVTRFIDPLVPEKKFFKVVLLNMDTAASMKFYFNWPSGHGF